MPSDDLLTRDHLDLGWPFWRVREALLVVEVASGRIVAANTAARQVFGYGPTDDLSVPLEVLVAAEVEETLRATLTQRAVREGTARVELPVSHRTGGVKQLELIASPVDVPSAAGRYVLVSIGDMSEHRRSRLRRQALLRLARFAAHGDPEELLSALLREAVSLLDAEDGGIAEWDAQRQRLVQVRSFLPSSSARRVILPDASASGRAARRRAPVIVNDYQRELGQATPAGRLGARAVIAAPLLSEGRLLGTLSITRFRDEYPFVPEDADVLELLASTAAATLVGLERSRQLQDAVEQLQRAKEAAETGERAKTALLANMSHELRTPLNAIIGYSDLLLEETHQHERGAYLADLQRIRSAGQHLLGLVDAVLELSDIEAGRLELRAEPFDLEVLVREVEASVRSLAETSRASFEVKRGAHLGWMTGDLIRLRQSLVSLLSNACVAARDGVVRLEVTRTARADGTEWVRFVVGNSDSDSDSALGPGIQGQSAQPLAPGDSPRPRGPGADLALALAERYCRLMGGQLTTLSDNGDVTFVAALPALRPEQHDLPPELAAR